MSLLPNSFWRNSLSCIGRSPLNKIARNEHWLEETLQEAKDRNWCTSYFCTTCGAHEFRGAFVGRAAEQAGVEIPEGSHFSRFDSFSSEESHKIFFSLTTALRYVDPQWRHTEALRLILMELHPPLIRWGVLGNLSEELSGTPAGDEYLAMHVHTENLAASRSDRAAYEAARPERRDERRQQTQLKHAARLKATKDQNRARQALLGRVTALSDSERLIFLAEQPNRFPLEMIPTELIPAGDLTLGLNQEQRSRLRELIDRRKGQWGKLRKRLEEGANR